MEFYGNLRNQLVRHSGIEMNRLNTAMQDPDVDDADVDFFELAQRQRLSKFAVHEQIRTKHMLLKSAIDGVQ